MQGVYWKRQASYNKRLKKKSIKIKNKIKIWQQNNKDRLKKVSKSGQQTKKDQRYGSEHVHPSKKN